MRLIFGWYSTNGVTPQDHLSIIDASSLINENFGATTATADDVAMYADEFGVLRYAKTNSDLFQSKHSPIVKNSEVSISNHIITNSNIPEDKNFSNKINDFETKSFAHSFYVSRYFTVLPSNTSTYNGIGNSLKVLNPEKYNIKVIDKSGNQYVDEYGINKYEIFIERYENETYTLPSSNYYRIIVALDQPDPVGLQLVYDKFERTEDGIPHSQFLNYKEYINTLPLYAYVVEESEVIDPSSAGKKVYSTQLFSHKENKLLKSGPQDEGWKVVTPIKAVQDPRTFQNFNWRLLAKINYNFSKIKDIYQNTERAVLKVAVLYSGAIENMHNPYIFANLEESVINQQNFLFENPLRPVGSNKTQRAYWALDIDSFISTVITDQSIDAFDYDFIVWTPNQTITASQKRALDMFLQNGVSVFLDCSMLDQSSLSASGLENFDYSLTSISKNTGYINIVEEYEEGDDNLNGWDLTEYQESSTYKNHNIFGARLNILNNYSVNPIRVFNGTPESSDGSAKSIVSLSEGSQTYTAILKDKYNVNSEFSSFVITCLNPFLTYINDNYGTSGLGVAGSNRGAVNAFPVGTEGDQTAYLSAAVLGPNKLFYNMLTEANKNKVNSRTKFSENSTVVWNISPWRNSWTINGSRDDEGKVTVLFEDEKQSFKFSDKQSRSTSFSAAVYNPKFCRELVPSIGQLLITDFEATSIQQDAASMINADYSNVDFYIECTNDNVAFLDFEKIDNTNYIFGETKTSYNIFKLRDDVKPLVASGSLSLDAHATVVSREFDIKSIYYPYIILDYNDAASGYQSLGKSVVKTPKEYLPGSQFVRDYDFDFKTQIFVTQTKTNRYTYKVYWNTSFSTPLDAQVGNISYISKRGIAESPDGIPVVSIQQPRDENPIAISNANSPFKGYAYPTNIYSLTDIQSLKPVDRASPRNSFHYTFDIPRSGRWNEYMVGGTSADNTTTDSTQVIYKEVGKPIPGEYNLDQRPAQSESDKIKNYIRTSLDTWEKFVAASTKIYWFAPTLADRGNNMANKGSVQTLGSKWEYFENFYMNECDAVPGSTKAARITTIRSVYTNTNNYVILPSMAKTIQELFKMPPGTVGKDFFKRQLERFLAAWEIFEPVQKQEIVRVEEVVTNTATGPQNNYVYYIQYTLKLNGYAVNLDGKYTAQTASVVTKYQADKKLNPNRNTGIVDSETKSVMATYWLDLYKNNKTKFETFKKAAPPQAQPFIMNALKYSDISVVCNASSTDEYRRISYTGIPGPTTIQDFIVVEVPQMKQQSGQPFQWQELMSVNIRAGGWNLGVQQIFLYEQDLAANAHGIPQFGPNNSIKAAPQNIIPAARLIPANGSDSISVGDKRKIKYIMIEVNGVALNDGVHGPNAEGFSIKDISFTIKTPGVPISAQKQETSLIDATNATAIATGTIYGETDLDSGDYGVFNLGTIAKALSSAARSKVTSIVLNDISLNVIPIVDDKPLVDDEGNVVERSFSKSFNKTIYSSSVDEINDSYEWEENESVIAVSALSEGASIENANPTISAVTKIAPTGSTNLTGSEISSQFAILTNRAPQYLISTTNGIEVISDEISEEYPVDNFYLADADINGLNSKQNIKLSVNAKDGVVALTDSVGAAAGFPDYSKFIMPNVETSFGSTILKWDLKDKNGQVVPPPDGLQWGFYNIRTKQFLGIKLSYQYYLANKRDIYIAVHAYDADRDASTLENIIGVENRVETLSEFSFPAKSICPLYSVRVSSRPKIYLSSPPKDLSKFDQWFINLSRGRFYKKIQIPVDYPFNDWKKNYKGKELRCFYDTTRIEIPSSPIFGSGYYSIIDEHPIVLSQNEIQVRHGSFVVAQEQTDIASINKKYTDASPIEAWVSVYIQDSNGIFQLINYNSIKNFDKHTGKISFEKEIVPSDPKKIKVDYVVKNPNAMLYHINGIEIPLNPYVNRNRTYFDFDLGTLLETLDKNPTMHFYILPRTVEELVNGEYVEIADYAEPDSVINYSIYKDIFNRTNDYNPFALYLGTAIINNTYTLNNVKVHDLRVKGGGISASSSVAKEAENNRNILSFNDIKSGKGKLYPNGGYVVIQIPKEVMDNFQNVNDIYDIVRSNLTAGVAFDIQDMDGNDWRTL